MGQLNCYICGMALDFGSKPDFEAVWAAHYAEYHEPKNDATV